MAKIINLRTARKQAKRQAAKEAAQSNAARFGEPKAQRDQRKAEKDRAASTLDNHRREP